MFGWFSKVLASLKYALYLDGVSAPEPKRLTPTDTCAVEDKHGPEIEYKCGHRHAERFTLNLFGEPITLTDAGYARRELCAECLLASMRRGLIRCAACGLSILYGEAVAVYVDNGGFKEEWKTPVVTGRERGAIACLRENCCPSAGFFTGYWTGLRVLKLRSPFAYHPGYWRRYFEPTSSVLSAKNKRS